jgi:sulfur-carrier protein
MKVSVKLFAVAKQWAEADAVELELPPDASVADLRKSLLSQLPRLEKFGPHLRFSVNSDYADEGTRIPIGAEVACIPPVSGG